MKRISLLFAMMVFSLGMALAQKTVTGTVLDSKGEALIGVSILEKGTTNGTVTDLDGNFSLKVKDDANLIFTYVGYATQTVAASGTTTFRITLEDSNAKLDEVIISGLATNVKRANAANAVSSISSAALTGTTVQSTMDGALYGKFTGADINANSGAPGGGMSIKLRGVTTLGGGSQPLYVVDGVLYDNSAISGGINTVSKAGGNATTSTQDNPSNRIADIDPEDIDRIEILKGASAAALYGSRAGSGVVIITTKKGKSGKPTVSFGQSIGQSMQLKKLGVRQWDATKAGAFSAGYLALFNANNGQQYNYEDELYGNKGTQLNTRLSVSGGNDKTTYFVGLTSTNQEGIVKNTGYKKNSFRLNLDQKLFSFLELSLNSNYVNSSTDRGFFNNDNSGTTLGISYSATPTFINLFPDANGVYPENPVNSSNFLETRDLITNNERVNRFTSGGQLTANLFSNTNNSLKFVGKAGIDYYTLETRALFPAILQFEKTANGGLNGQGVYGSNVNFNNNLSAFLVHTYTTNSNISFRSQLGVTRDEFNLTSTLIDAAGLKLKQENVDQAATTVVLQDRIPQLDKGFFVQEEFNYQDKVIATVGVRGDKSSRNGDANKFYYFPKGSLALNLTEFGVGKGSDILSSLKLRTAYGESGTFPAFGSIYTALVNVPAGGPQGSGTSTFRGNINLGPERQQETEFGFDLGLLKNKLSLDFTYYIKNVKNLLLNKPVKNATGFSSAAQNAGDLQNKGIEIALDATPVSTKDFSYNVRTAFWLNRSKFTRLNLAAPQNTGAFGTAYGTFRLQEGASPTQIVGRATKAEGADTTGVNSGLKVYGDAQADFNISFNNTLKYKNFELNFLIHVKQGGKIVNLTNLLSDYAGTTFDYDDKTLDPTGALTNSEYRLNNEGVTASPYIEDASYMRVREIGLAYRIPKSVFNNKADIKIGFNGRNLINVFPYTGYDPEVSNFGTNALSQGIDVAPFPSSKTFNFTLNATF